MKILLKILIVFICINTGLASLSQNYEALKALLLSNFPSTFEGKQIHPKTYKLGMAIINQLCEDFRKIGFDENKAQWYHVNDYVLYDTNSQKKIGTTCWLVYKTTDNKIIGTYMMNTENPVNNRLMHTSYHISGGSYKIKQKITRDDFSHVICQEPAKKSIRRF